MWCGNERGVMGFVSGWDGEGSGLRGGKLGGSDRVGAGLELGGNRSGVVGLGVSVWWGGLRGTSGL